MGYEYIYGPCSVSALASYSFKCMLLISGYQIQPRSIFRTLEKRYASTTQYEYIVYYYIKSMAARLCDITSRYNKHRYN